MSYKDEIPGSDAYRAKFWSSPEGRALYPTLFGTKAPAVPDPRARMAEALEKHDRAMRRWAFAPLGTPKPKDLLSDEQLEDMQRATLILGDADPFSQERATAASDEAWNANGGGAE